MNEGFIVADGIIITKELEYVHEYDGAEDVCFCQHGENPEDCDICNK